MCAPNMCKISCLLLCQLLPSSIYGLNHHKQPVCLAACKLFVFRRSLAQAHGIARGVACISICPPARGKQHGGRDRMPPAWKINRRRLFLFCNAFSPEVHVVNSCTVNGSLFVASRPGLSKEAPQHKHVHSDPACIGDFICRVRKHGS